MKEPKPAPEKEAKKSKEKKDEISTPVKQYYTVKMEALIPVILTYKVYAESPTEAITQATRLTNQQFSTIPQILFSKLRRTKASVYRAGMSIVELVKNF